MGRYCRDAQDTHVDGRCPRPNRRRERAAGLMAGVTVTGADRLEAYLSNLGQSVKSAHGATVRVGSPANYAFGIETGYRRSGRLARAAGGLFFLQRAYLAVKPRIPAIVAEHLAKGETA